jgi:O-antigen/teichoic acid export membrane protein
LSIGGVARGGLFLFIGSVIANTIGYVYWFLVSVFSGAEVVGIANSVVSLSSLVSGIAILGIPTGVQRFLGQEYSRKNVGKIKTYFWSSFAFTLTLCLLSALIIWVVALTGIPLLGFSESMLLLAGVIAFLSFSGIMSALFTSIVRTEYIAASTVASAITKVSLGVFLVYIGFGWLGAVMGIIFAGLSLVLLMFFFTSRELRRLGDVKIKVSRKAAQESLRAGFVSWLPGVIGMLGQQLAVLTVFAIQGGSEAGFFFIAYAIFSIVNMLPASFTSILFPILSGMGAEGKRVAWRALKICLALACPPAAFLAVYSGFLLSLMGSQYVQATSTLSILALSIIPLTLVSTVSNLVYAFGSYGRTLVIGLAVNVPQVILYFFFVPVYGGFGAAISFLIGTITGLAVATVVSKVSGFQVSLKKISGAIIAPLGAALLCFLVHLDWLIGGIVVLLISVFFYGRLGVVERSDLAEVARAFASEQRVAKAGQRLNWLLKIIYGH